MRVLYFIRMVTLLNFILQFYIYILFSYCWFGFVFRFPFYNSYDRVTILGWIFTFFVLMGPQVLQHNISKCWHHLHIPIVTNIAWLYIIWNQYTISNINLMKWMKNLLFESVWAGALLFSYKHCTCIRANTKVEQIQIHKSDTVHHQVLERAISTVIPPKSLR